MLTINFPYQCTEKAIFDFCTEIENYSGSGIDKLLIDFNNMGRIEPFTMIYVARHIRDFNRTNPNMVISCCGYQDKKYAANMAFFRAFGLKHGREPNCKDGNDSFVPFTILRIQTIKDEAAKEWEAEQDIIERRSEHLAQIISREIEGNLVDALTFAIREVIVRLR